MTRPSHILRARSVLQRQRALRNHLPGVGSHNMNPENSIRLRICQKLDHTIRIQIRLRPRIGTEGKGADLILDPLLLQLLLVLPDPRDFGVRVHDGGDGVVVDVAVILGQVFDGGDAFFLCFVREHGAEGAVADDADVRDFGPVFAVDDQAAAVVGFQAHGVEVEARGVGAAADGDEDDVGVELLRY